MKARTIVNKTQAIRHRFSLDRGEDPLTLALEQQETNESPEVRTARLAQEEEAQRRSDAIDRELEAEAKEKKGVIREGGELEVLLLGPPGAFFLLQGKDDFRQAVRLKYDVEGIHAEREATCLVIILNIIQSTQALLSLIEEDTSSIDSAADPATTRRPLSPGSRDPLAPLSPSESNYRRRMRLAPLLALEGKLRETLGVIASGPSAPSVSAHAVEWGQNDSVQSPDWIESSMSRKLDGLWINSRALPPTAPRRNIRSRGASPSSEPIFAPGFAERCGVFGFGSGKESRRAKAQGSARESGATVGDDGAFLAGKDDPIHLLAALKDEISGAWKEAVSRGLVAGEGPLKHRSSAGFEMTESARYFLESLPRIASPAWLPDDKDLLNVRVRTLGIEIHRMKISPTQSYKICDVAGARGVKHTWAPYFESAAAIIFISDVSRYCSADPRINRLSEALDLFEEIASNPVLRSVVIIVFLNKTDQLRKRVKSGAYPVQQFFPAYEGGTKSIEVLSFFQTLFEQRHHSRSQPLYVFSTQANDTKSIGLVVAALNDILMRSTLVASGLL